MSSCRNSGWLRPSITEVLDALAEPVVLSETLLLAEQLDLRREELADHAALGEHLVLVGVGDHHDAWIVWR
jgi:hypothetical protein